MNFVNRTVWTGEPSYGQAVGSTSCGFARDGDRAIDEASPSTSIGTGSRERR